ncbi:hypothetical protein LG003_20390 [Photorhabdus kleinii]|uniref:hypothetical protein n=1 Tax=Photorhabdus kleinii TaxID=768034 RepID=UPI0021D4D43C|nr:hypothetical protein [Photorhabdus kleinii]MCT8345136.1 hypothetical protein [Photorhabdus kleinii]
MDKYIEPIPIVEITTPKNGKGVIRNAYWLVKDKNVFRSKMGNSYQFNRQELVVRKFYEELLALDDGYTVEQIPVAFID